MTTTILETPVSARLKNILIDRISSMDVDVACLSGADFSDILNLESFLLSDLPTDVEISEALDDERVSSLQEKAIGMFSKLEFELERQLIEVASSNGGNAIFSRNDDAIINYMARYRCLAAVELSLGHVTADDHVAFVGAGAFPITAIEYVRQSGCRATGLEILEDSAQTASKMAHLAGVGERFQVVFEDGKSADYSPYSVVVVGVMARPKPEILSRIAHTSDVSTRVLCRTTHGLRKLIYPPTSPRELRPFSVAEEQRATGYQTLSVLRLERP